MKALIISTSGMIGKGLLLECLENPLVESVIAVNRQSCNIQHPKMREILHADFYDFSPVIQEFAHCDACFFCMGVTSAGLREEEYKRITYTLTLNFAQLLVGVNSNVVFCYISGAGSDSTEHGNTMWARVKGKTENALLALPFKDAYMLRPGYIQPLKGIKSKTFWYNALYAVVKPLYPLFKSMKSLVTDTSTLGRAMIHVAAQGYGKKILESTDINNIGQPD